MRPLTCKDEALGMRLRGARDGPSLCPLPDVHRFDGLLGLMRGRDAVADSAGAFRISEPSPPCGLLLSLFGEEPRQTTSDNANVKRSPVPLEAADPWLGWGRW